MKYTVDRIEKDVAILEENHTLNMIDVKLSEFTFAIKEGDILIKENDKWTKDEKLTNKRKEDILKKYNRLRGIK